MARILAKCNRCHYWAHENEELPNPALTMAESRARLQMFLSWLPEEWNERLMVAEPPRRGVVE